MSSEGDTPRERARAAIYEAIARQASEECSLAELKDLGETYRNVRYGDLGLQGAIYDYHETHHEGGRRRRPPGFQETDD